MPSPSLSLTEKQVRFEYLTSKLVIECAIHGVEIICYRHRSTLAEDLAYFQSGLSQIDPRITPTPHMRGLAKDFAIPNADASGYDWSSPGYDTMGEIAESLGLIWGGRWKTLVDKNHVQFQEGA
jgi:peptidoglycan L-alanyl-D-glutamate endopeptidase CwlK